MTHPDRERVATRISYDAAAADYARVLGDELAAKPWDRAMLSGFVEALGGGLVADIGCGPGHVTGWLAGRGATVLGLDLSPTMCTVGSRTTRLPFAAADMTALPIASGSLGGIVCLYAVLHLDDDERAAAYREFVRVLRPGGLVLLAFHTSAPGVEPGGTVRPAELFGHPVDLTFRYLDATVEVDRLDAAGLGLQVRLDRSPHETGEHESRRSYMVVRAG